MTGKHTAKLAANALDHEPTPFGVLKKELGWTTRTLRGALNQLEREGTAEIVDGKGWKLTPSSR
jgi:DNA-binding HxlR family transcriptional regulator